MEKYPSGRNIAEMLRKRWHLGKCNDDIVVVLLTEVNIVSNNVVFKKNLKTERKMSKFYCFEITRQKNL